MSSVGAIPSCIVGFVRPPSARLFSGRVHFGHHLRQSVIYFFGLFNDPVLGFSLGVYNFGISALL